jgi:hypothetical protein
MINALSDEDRKRLFELLNVVSRDDALAMPVPPGYTRDPSTGRVYRVQASREHTNERDALDTAVKTAVAAMKRHTTDNSGTVAKVDGNTVVTWPQNTPAGVITRHVELTGVFDAAKAAFAAYKTQHPAEFTAPTRGRGRGTAGRGRGRGRGT